MQYAIIGAFVPATSKGPMSMMRHARLFGAALVVAAGFIAPTTLLHAQNDQFLANLLARAEAGDAEAQYEYGMQLQLGIDASPDHRAAATWLRRAAEQDYLEAQFALGLLYNAGRGVQQDCAEAADWLLRAARHGHRESQLTLGMLYQNCDAESRDYVESVAWLRAAAEGGHPIAMSILSGLYAAGRGVIKDPVLACMWQFLAAYRSSGRNRDQMVRMAELMARALTRVERREALRLAAEWDAAHPQ